MTIGNKDLKLSRSSDYHSQDDIGVGIVLVSIASVAGWVFVVGALMINNGTEHGWVVSVTALSVFVLSLTKLFKLGNAF